MQVTKIYCISTDDIIDTHWDNITNEEFIELAERYGDTFDLDTFANAFNQSDVNTNTDVIRIITTETRDPRDIRICTDIEYTLDKVEEQIERGEEKAFTIGYLKQALWNAKNILQSKV
jgi:hypothetical protein